MKQVRYFNVNLVSQPGIVYLSLQTFFFITAKPRPSYFTEAVWEEQHVNRTKRVRVLSNGGFLEREGG